MTIINDIITSLRDLVVNNSLTRTLTSTSADAYTLKNNASAAPASASTAAFFGSYDALYSDPARAANMTSAQLIGTFGVAGFRVDTTANGVCAGVYGGRFEIAVANDGAAGRTALITAAFGTYARPQISAAAGTTSTITDYYGSYLSAPILTGAGTTVITNRWGYYAADPLAINHFNGQVLIGSAAPVASEKVRIAGGSAPATPGSTDVLVGAGAVAIGSTLRVYGTSTIVSMDSTGQIRCAYNIGNTLATIVVGTPSANQQCGISFADVLTAKWNLYKDTDHKLKLYNQTIDVLTFGTDGNIGVKTGSTTTAAITLPAGTTAVAPLNFINGAAPTTPQNGDIWFDGTDLKMRVGGVTKTFTLV